MADTNKMLEILRAGKQVVEDAQVVAEVKPKVEAEYVLLGRDFSDGLQGTAKQRLEGERTIQIRVVPGKQPEVVFTGFWTGKYVKAAQNSLSRAYRRRKFKPYRTQHVEVEAKEA